jgi:hypothetical protein
VFVASDKDLEADFKLTCDDALVVMVTAQERKMMHIDN